ncbi:MAG: hypothetical protein ACR2NN_07640 [Bryobacteraceae bacterium]
MNTLNTHVTFTTPLMTWSKVLAIVWIWPALTAQTKAPQSQSTANHPQSALSASTTPAKMAPMPLVAPLFIEDSQRTSLITMVNSAPQSVDVDVVLYALSGDRIAGRTLTLSAYSQQTIAVADLLQIHDVQYGSVFVVPHRASTMAAQLSIFGRAGASTNDIEEEFQMMMGSGPSSYRAVSASKSPVVAIRSLSPESQTLAISCLKEHSGVVAKTGQSP